METVAFVGGVRTCIANETVSKLEPDSETRFV